MKTAIAILLWGVVISVFHFTAAQAALNSVEIKLTANDASEDDWFGSGVAIDGNRAIVGARYVRSAYYPVDTGAAYIFDVTTGNELFKVTGSDIQQEEEFGRAVFISGTTSIVGAPKADTMRGSAYLFDVTTGQQLHKLTASDGADLDEFGFSVGISGNRAIVGAWKDGVGDPGSAYLFNTTTGNQLFKLTTNESTSRFGVSVAIDGSLALVGTQSEAAYLFNVSTGQPIRKLTPSDGLFGDRFGNQVAISGNIALVGAPFDIEFGDDAGAAYLFNVTTGQELFKLTASDAGIYQTFGTSVAISGNLAIVGVTNDSSTAGGVYVFDVTTGQELGKVDASGGNTEDLFGHAVGISGDTAIVGAMFDDEQGYRSGSAYLLNLTSSAPGDFDGDGNVNGRDFLAWQRGESPTPLSQLDLAVWQAEYGPNPLTATSTAVPEPSLWIVLSVGMVATLFCRKPLAPVCG